VRRDLPLSGDVVGRRHRGVAPAFSNGDTHTKSLICAGLHGRYWGSKFPQVAFDHKLSKSHLRSLRRDQVPLPFENRRHRRFLGTLLSSHIAKRRTSKSKPAAREYHVYIIELSRDPVPEPCALAPLYVGQTAHTPVDRFAKPSSRDANHTDHTRAAAQPATSRVRYRHRCLSARLLFEPSRSRRRAA
jgi:hypothetical protein